MASLVALPTQLSQATKSSDQWEPWKDIITELYGSHKLDDLMKKMKEVHGFKATWVPKQHTELHHDVGMCSDKIIGRNSTLLS
jgi:hypothetical protein